MANQFVNPDTVAAHYANVALADQVSTALDTLAAQPGAGAYAASLQAHYEAVEARIAYVNMLIETVPQTALMNVGNSNI